MLIIRSHFGERMRLSYTYLYLKMTSTLVRPRVSREKATFIQLFTRTRTSLTELNPIVFDPEHFKVFSRFIKIMNSQSDDGDSDSDSVC